MKQQSNKSTNFWPINQLLLNQYILKKILQKRNKRMIKKRKNNNNNIKIQTYMKIVNNKNNLKNMKKNDSK